MVPERVNEKAEALERLLAFNAANWEDLKRIRQFEKDNFKLILLQAEAIAEAEYFATNYEKPFDNLFT